MQIVKSNADVELSFQRMRSVGAFSLFSSFLASLLPFVLSLRAVPLLFILLGPFSSMISLALFVYRSSLLLWPFSPFFTPSAFLALLHSLFRPFLLSRRLSLYFSAFDLSLSLSHFIWSSSFHSQSVSLSFYISYFPPISLNISLFLPPPLLQLPLALRLLLLAPLLCYQMRCATNVSEKICLKHFA